MLRLEREKDWSGNESPEGQEPGSMGTKESTVKKYGWNLRGDGNVL